MIRGHLARDDRFAEAETRVYRRDRSITAVGIGGEQHARRVGIDHLLNDDRHRDRRVGNVVASTVGDRPVGKEARHTITNAISYVLSRNTEDVSCWPANEAVGRSSAVADDRTA